MSDAVATGLFTLLGAVLGGVISYVTTLAVENGRFRRERDARAEERGTENVARRRAFQRETVLAVLKMTNDLDDLHKEVDESSSHVGFARSLSHLGLGDPSTHPHEEGGMRVQREALDGLALRLLSECERLESSDLRGVVASYAMNAIHDASLRTSSDFDPLEDNREIEQSSSEYRETLTRALTDLNVALRELQ